MSTHTGLFKHIIWQTCHRLPLELNVNEKGQPEGDNARIPLLATLRNLLEHYVLIRNSSVLIIKKYVVGISLKIPRHLAHMYVTQEILAGILG